MTNKGEPTVQVPVSLIEGLLDDFGNRRARAVRDARALLPQPTPSAEPSPLWCANDEPHGSHRERNQFGGWNECTGRPAIPPRVEDMAPGTTFVDSEGERWTIRQDRDSDPWANSDSGDAWDLDDFDPSTIRDVTPPTEQP